MRKNSLKPLCTALILAASSEAAIAADGQINFIGSVSDNTCPVVVKDLNGSVAGDVGLGTVPATSLANSGDIAGGGAFTMTIDTTAPGCSVTGKKAVVRFQSLSGSAGSSGQWIGITKDGGKEANNVALQIKDATGKDVQLGLASEPYLDLTQPLRFTTNYIATGTATAGSANAKASFTVDYQ
ncbi:MULTISPECIES: fimbrial protein [Pseudomonas]|uniref:fimbrial protein n=1 Tax=Pseudomonas TaxID=286 RepID=UPI000B34D1D2|nr:MULTISPECIES: fimbrial protein [Pseudomonas]PMY33061.1 fimbrial protein [Pseudomonas sp. GW456-L14]PMY50017.1 fimbrial protein [Pseudomonas sp. GW456-L12]PMY64840.1 fimbrial protein [Pseudomonas sp. FW305-25]PMY69240.1 fimbrial protein [Pseudomonas sp. FW126-L8]PNA80071.1 fimbrial protein [Pseudomonas sp. FW305-76]